MPSDLEAWEEKHGKIPDDVILLVFYDWGKHWPDKKEYLGTDTKNTSLLHFPGKSQKVNEGEGGRGVWLLFFPPSDVRVTQIFLYSTFLFEGIHPDASRWLVKNRKIKLIGLDTASLDYGQSKMFESHQILFEKNIPGLENVAHMDKLPTKGFTVYAAPMFITGGSGAPCRLFARLDEVDKKGRTVNAGVKLINMNMFWGITVFLFFCIL